MAKLSDNKKQQLMAEVRKEFPDDVMMQEVHYVRLVHYHETKDLSATERVRYFQKGAKRLPTTGAKRTNGKPPTKKKPVATVKTQ